MTALLRLPLHYQIFIALVLGTIVGVIVNPGDVAMEPMQADVQVTAEPVQDGQGIRITVDDPQNWEDLRKTFDRIDDLERWYPELARQYDRKPITAEISIEVTHRKFYIAEDGRTITITYTRRHNDRSVVTRYTAADAEELAREHPKWATLYAEHGGGLSRTVTTVSKAVGDLFLRLLRMVTIPLIVTSLITGVAGLGNTSRLGSMFGKTMLYYVSTSFLAITTGLVVVNLINPGLGAELPGGGEGVLVEGDQSLIGIFWGLVTSMVPPNPVQSLAAGDFLSIITFSILVGVFIIRVGGRSGEILRDFFQAAFDIVMAMTMAIIRLAPIGVFAFMTYATASQGLEIFKTLAWYMLTVFAALLVHAAVVMPLILKFVARRSPWEYAQALSPALMTAFSTASSNGTLPLTMTCVEERAGVSNRVTSFVLPLGATINMDGTALYEAVAVLFIAQAYYGAVPLESQILVAVTALMASVGAAGIPHAGLVMMAIVLQAVGLPLEAQGVIIAVDRVLDMCRTTVNVWSDSCGCAVLERFEGNNNEPAPVAVPAPVNAPQPSGE